MSIGETGPNGNQRGEPVDGLARTPHHSSKDEDAIERIVVSPGEVPGNTDKHASPANLARPHLRTEGALFGAAHQNTSACSIQIACKTPVTLIGNSKLRQAHRQRMRLVQLPLGCVVTTLRIRWSSEP